MKFLFVYELGEAPEARSIEEYPDADAAKAHARESLVETLKASSAGSASLCLGQLLGDDEDDVHWLGEFDLEREGEPRWSDD